VRWLHVREHAHAGSRARTPGYEPGSTAKLSPVEETHRVFVGEFYFVRQAEPNQSLTRLATKQHRDILGVFYHPPARCSTFLTFLLKQHLPSTANHALGCCPTTAHATPPRGSGSVSSTERGTSMKRQMAVHPPSRLINIVGIRGGVEYPPCPAHPQVLAVAPRNGCLRRQRPRALGQRRLRSIRMSKS